MLEKPTLIVHTTHFSAGNSADPALDPERASAVQLGEDLYTLLTRPKNDPFAWGAGIPVRIATQWDRIDCNEAKYVVVIPVLGGRAFRSEATRELALETMDRWNVAGNAARVLPVLVNSQWRVVEGRMKAPVLTEVTEQLDPRRATINEILIALARVLSSNDAYAARLFISHAKADLAATDNAAKKIHAAVTLETTGRTFFDRTSVLPGEDLGEQLHVAGSQGVFVAVRGDRYSSRSWCRRELLHAKQQRLPTLVVEVLSSGEARSAAYAGNGPTVVWDRTARAPEGQVVTLAMVEAVRHLFFLAESRRVIAATGLPESSECLSRPLELLDIAALRARKDAALVVLHPDPPLPAFERTMLQEADKRLRPVTPTTAFSGAIGSSIHAPLQDWQIALSLSDSPDAPEQGGPDGNTADHVKDATTFLARALIGVGAGIAYGGDLRTNGFTHLLAPLVASYADTGRGKESVLHSYLGATIDPDAEGANLAFTMHSLREDPGALLPTPKPGEPVPAHRAALYFSDMRRLMALETQARVILGGASVPRSHDPKGYGGRYPGVVEEAWRTLQLGKPLYVAGGFGGAGALVAEAMDGDAIPTALNDATWANNDAWRTFIAAWGDDADVVKLGVPKNQIALNNAIRALAREKLASDETSLAWNGLTIAENRALFRTRDPLTLTALVLKGLIARSTALAQGKLRIELVEGDVAEATGLEVLVVPTFRDLPLDGAGAALDRISGGAATRAHRAGTAVPSGSSALGVDFVYAADLGTVSEALKDVAGHARSAATATSEVLRRHGFKSAGIVTFFGNVASSLSEVVGAMISGLLHAGETTELVWFERDPVRAALVAGILTAAPEVVLTRRAAPIPQAPPASPGKKRTIVTVHNEAGALDVTLLLHRANGLAPIVHSDLDDAVRAKLAGLPSDAAPDPSDLEKRGGQIVELVFGAKDSPVLDPIGGSELVIMHDAAAGAIPYEAMVWHVDGQRVTPATKGGLVRHLLTPGIAAERALTRPTRAGKLGVLVVINPLGDLEGAEAEGNALLETLRGGPFDVTVLRGDDATIARVREEIANPAIDVVHYCGHAFFRGPGPADSGLNCADGPLTLQEIRDVKSVPRLAFVNACQAGRVRGAPPSVREPQAFAEFFLRAGVDAYLGAFWLVSDVGAAMFAAKVYAALADGAELGDAVVVGRKALQEARNSDWANYVLYGHGGFRLVQSAASARDSDVPRVPAPSVRVDGKTIVASWTFEAKEAPKTFGVAVVDAATSEPIALAKPMNLDRREQWLGSMAVVTFIVTASLSAESQAPIQLRPSAGDPVNVEQTATGGAQSTRSIAALRGSAPIVARRLNDGTAGASAKADTSRLRSLRALLDQQPDGGKAVLKALQRSADPEELRAQIDAELSETRTRALWSSKPKVDEAALARFVDIYEAGPISLATAADQAFETKHDWAKYTLAPGASGFTLGDDVLPPIWKTLPSPAVDMTHTLRAGEFKGSIDLALFSDNGNGLHASRAIAKQIVDSKLPYAFHLGDVYYGGSQDEFADYFETPLKGMFDTTELFMITGNHEMFAGGRWFQELLVRKAKQHEKQRQRGEMFRLRGPGFQIIGVDTMFVGAASGRLRLHDRADKAVLDVVESWLSETPDDLTILMTTNEPWDKGSDQVTPLYQSLCDTIAGRVDLWFWGNVHYAALFEPWRFDDAGSRKRGVIGSCIGHGGYPFYTEGNVGELPDGLKCRWLEKKSRYWPSQDIRPDVGANGWCRMKLTRAEKRWNVGLTFIDWVGRERLRASLVREDGEGIRYESVSESDQEAMGAEPTWKAIE